MITFEEVKEAVVKATNYKDESRAFDISAHVRVVNNDANNIDQGIVIADNITICTFNRWGNNNLNANFQTNDINIMTTALIAINTFINEVEENANNGFTIITN